LLSLRSPLAVRSGFESASLQRRVDCELGTGATSTGPAADPPWMKRAEPIFFRGAKQFRAVKRQKIVFAPQLADLPVHRTSPCASLAAPSGQVAAPKLRGRQSQ
jgi:hypothetical protein